MPTSAFFCADVKLVTLQSVVLTSAFLTCCKFGHSSKRGAHLCISDLMQIWSPFKTWCPPLHFCLTWCKFDHSSKRGAHLCISDLMCKEILHQRFQHLWTALIIFQSEFCKDSIRHVLPFFGCIYFLIVFSTYFTFIKYIVLSLSLGLVVTPACLMHGNKNCYFLFDTDVLYTKLPCTIRWD